MNRFAGIELFVATARLGSFSAAARNGGLSPSAAAKSVSRLEERLGRKLFHRTTRSLSLTAEGEAYLAVCENMLRDLDAAESELTSTDAALKGRIRLQLPGAFGRRHILPELLNLASAHPHLNIVAAFSEQTLDIARAGYDLAIRIGYLGTDPSLMVRRVGTHRLVFCASPDYLERYGEPKTLEELQAKDCITGPRYHDHFTWPVRGDDGQLRSLQVQPRYELSDGDAMLAAGLSGCGVMQMPTWLVGEHLDNGSLVEILQPYAGAEMPIQIVWPSTEFSQPRVRALIDHFVTFAKRPGSPFSS